MHPKVTSGKVLLVTSLALAIAYFAFLPHAEADPPITLTPDSTSAEIPKGAQKQFTVTVVGQRYDPPLLGPTLNLNVVSISPSGIPLSSAVFSPSSLTVPTGGTGFNAIVTLTISTTTSTPPGTYIIIANGKFANDTASTVRTNDVTLTLYVGDFAISVSPSTVEVRQQASASAFVNISSISNFNGQIQLSWIWNNQAPGVLVTLTGSVLVPKQSWISATLTLDAALTALPGTYSGFVVGIYPGSPQITHSFLVTIMVKPLPGLVVAIDAIPNPAVVSKISIITIRVTSEGAPIQLSALTISATGGLLGATSGFTDTGGQFLTTFNSTTPGQVRISVTATRAGYITGTNTLILNIAGNFVVSIAPSDVTMTLGSTRTFQIVVQSTEGFNSAVTLSLPTLVPGLFASINPPEVTPPPNGVVTATLTLSLNLTAAPGSLDLTITATRTPLIKSSTLRLNIPVRDFLISIRPENLVIAQGKQGLFNISVVSRGGFSGLIDMRSTGIPSDVEISIVPNSFSLEVGATRNALLSVRASESSGAGNFLFLIEANSGIVRRSAQAVLVILPLLTVTIDSSPRVSSFIVDGALIQPTDLPKQYRWVQGEIHTLGVPNHIVNGTSGIQYVFTRWSDGTTTQARILTINSQGTYKAEFKTQYFLTVRSILPTSPPPSLGAGWFDNNTQASISTPQIVNIAENRRYDFRGWMGNISDSKTNTTVLMNGPKVVTSTYTLQFFIYAATEPKSLAEISNGNKWHDTDLMIEFATTKRVRDYSFRFWTVDGNRFMGLLVSIRIDRPFNLTANYVFLPKVSIVWANTTISKTEFQGESAYIWLKIANTNDRPGEVRLDAQSSFDGISVNPKSIVLNFQSGQSYVIAYELRFLKNGTGTFEAKINETADSADSISVPLKIFSSRSRDNLRAIGKAVSVENLAVLNDLMATTPEVKALAENILAVANVPQVASPVDKARALFTFVVQHYEPATNIKPQSIAHIASELQATGGALSNQKVTGDSRVIVVFYGGLLRSVDIPVRPLIGIMEMSPLQEIPYLTLHTWIEFRVDRDWLFVDPAEGLFEISPTRYPLGIQNLGKDPKMYYELSPKWGGPIEVVAYEGRAVDITESYKATMYPPLDGFTVYTRGDTNIVMRTDAGRDFIVGLPYAAIWTPVDPQAPEIRALKAEGQMVLVSSSTPLSKYPIFVSGPRRTNYTFSVMEVSPVFPIIDSMGGSFLERSTIEHTVQLRSDGKLQTGQVEHVSYSDKLITIISNSTVTSALSSTDVRAVKLTLVGKEGSVGVLNITVPSNLLIDDLRSSADKIVVLLDGKLAKPEFTNLGARMVISLMYNHSTRNVVVYLKTFDVSFTVRDPFGLVIHDAELMMEGPTHEEIKESDNPLYEHLIPGEYKFTIKYRGEQQVLHPEITDRDLSFMIDLVRSDATIAAFATGIIIAVAAISITTQLVLSRVFQRKSTSS